jgi:hypothetical protein
MNLKHRAGLWISLAEEKKIEAIFFRKDDQIGLSVTRGKPCGWLIPSPLADENPDFSRGELTNSFHSQ